MENNQHLNPNKDKVVKVIGNYFNDKIEEFYSDGTNELRNRQETVIAINNKEYYVKDGLIKISIKKVVFFSKEKQRSYFKQK